MTQQDVANLLGCGQGKINKIESGTVAVKLTDLRRMLEAFSVGKAEADMMIELARSSPSQRGQWTGYRSAVPHWFRTFTDLEPAAAEILSWHGERIPGPLQSEHFMLKQFSEARASDVTALVRNRLERRQVFDLKRPPYYRFILSEAAFQRMPGGPNPAVALDQVEHLLEAIRSAVIRIGDVAIRHEEPDLVPLGRGRHALERAQMAAVHRQDQIELGEIARPHLPRAKRAQVIAAPLRVVLRALIGRRAHMPVADAGRLDVELESLLCREVPQHRFRRRRAADVAGADE
jgi:transcriptional regulator with XRE-family HTH domain